MRPDEFRGFLQLGSNGTWRGCSFYQWTCWRMMKLCSSCTLPSLSSLGSPTTMRAPSGLGPP